METGKRRRMKKIVKEKSGRTVIVPMDHGVTVGPIHGIDVIEETLSLIDADAVVLHKGIARKMADRIKMGLIMHMSASTALGKDPNNKVIVAEVDEAIKMGADAISIHVNVGSDTESRQLELLGKIAKEAEEWGIPLIAMMYPRGEKVKHEHDVSAVKHAARIGAELGADIIKTNYTGSIESFAEVVDGCPVPVVIAGGPKVNSDIDLLNMIHEAIKAGAGGVAIGRNVFQHKNPEKITKAIKRIVHDNWTAEMALEVLYEGSMVIG
jgi:predicted phospho-2-dehydro-3-deoxyheptonate aldolase